MTKILSWNVNSLRIRLAELERIAHEENPDVRLPAGSESQRRRFSVCRRQSGRF